MWRQISFILPILMAELFAFALIGIFLVAVLGYSLHNGEDYALMICILVQSLATAVQVVVLKLDRRVCELERRLGNRTDRNAEATDAPGPSAP